MPSIRIKASITIMWVCDISIIVTKPAYVTELGEVLKL